MEPDKLRSIFGNRSTPEYFPEEPIIEEPEMAMSVFIHGVLKHSVLDAMMADKYKESWKAKKEIVKSQFYLKLLITIEQVGIERISEFSFKNNFDENEFPFTDFKKALIHLRSYFESSENYEICHKIQLFLKIFS